MKVSRGALGALFLAALCGCAKSEPPPAASASPRTQGASVAVVAQQGIPEVVEAVGTLKARSSAVIYARIAGTVSGVFVTEGDRVGKGRLLARIASTESGAAAAGALSGVEEAQRAVEEAQSRYRLTDAEFARFDKLYQEQAVTRQEFEVRRMEKETAAQGVARAQARLAQSRHGARAATAVAGYGAIAAPFPGTVIAKQVETGQTVFPGTPLFTVEGSDGLRLEVAAPESLLGKLHAGERVRLELAGAEQSGTVTQIVPSVDPASRTFLVKIDVATAASRAGSYGKAYFPVGTRQGIAVPAAALLQRGALTSVWAVSRDGIARMRLVRTGKTLGNTVEVLSGVDAGDRIVVGGTEKVSDGARVE